jgi:predicted dehydrogenase
MSASKIRWGILGTANIARKQLIPAIQASNNGEVVAVGSRNLASAQVYAKELGIPHAYGSYEALLADPEIDAIYNPLPNDGHAPWSIKALRAHKHVLVEKPIAMDAVEAQTLVDVAHETGLWLAEAFMYRFHPQHAKVHELLATNALGKIATINAGFSYALSAADSDNVRLKPELGGGGLWDVGCYCVSSIRMFAGQEPDAVSGFATYGPSSGVDENFVGTLHFPNGLLAHFECGMRVNSEQQYTLFGDKGRLHVDEAFRPDDRPQTIRVVYGDHVETFPIPVINQYTLLVEDFADAILNKRPPRFAPEDGVQNMRVLDALALSARELRVVML